MRALKPSLSHCWLQRSCMTSWKEARCVWSLFECVCHSLSVYVTLWVCMSLFECVCVYTVHVVMHVHVHIIMWVCVTCWNSRLSSWFPVNSNLGMRVLVCVHMHTRMGVCMGTVSESDPRKDQNEGLGDRMWSVPSTSSWLIHATWLHSYVCILEIVTRQH